MPKAFDSTYSRPTKNLEFLFWHLLARQAADRKYIPLGLKHNASLSIMYHVMSGPASTLTRTSLTPFGGESPALDNEHVIPLAGYGRYLEGNPAAPAALSGDDVGRISGAKAIMGRASSCLRDDDLLIMIFSPKDRNAVRFACVCISTYAALSAVQMALFFKNPWDLVPLLTTTLLPSGFYGIILRIAAISAVDVPP